MTQPPEWRELDAFIDGELPLSRQLELEASMKQDPAFRSRVESLRQLHLAVREGADYHATPRALRLHLQAVLAAAAGAARTDSQPAPAPPTPGVAVQNVRPRARRRPAWFGLPVASATTAALGGAALVWVATRLGAPAEHSWPIENDVVASHVRATLAERPIDVASADGHTVKPWLSSRLDFSPPVAPPKLAGSVFLGGRTDYVGGRPVAVLAYRQGRHAVDDYIWPAGLADSGPVFAARQGFRLAHWSSQGMSHWVISDLGENEFAALVDAMRQADSGR